MYRVAVVGASGYAGAELLRICAGHEQFEVVAAIGDSSAGTKISDRYPHLAGVVGDQVFVEYSPGIAAGTDLTFLALPHGKAQQLVPALRTETKKIVDLSADFRFNSPAPYEHWYGKKHESPELLGEFVFGLPELFRESLPGADLIAVAGCYVTTATLALAPLVGAGVIEPTGIVVDAVSGVTGAGRTAAPEMAFPSVNENFIAYGLLNHRHTPEMEMAIGLHAGTDVQLIFTPHLAPMNRGILATCYAQPVGAATTADAIDCLASFYDDEVFVDVSDRSPGTKATLGSNSVHLTARVDLRTGWLIVIAALDNLVKGAAGQAIQCANISLGLPEATGLTTAGIYP